MVSEGREPMPPRRSWGGRPQPGGVVLGWRAPVVPWVQPVALCSFSRQVLQPRFILYLAPSFLGCVTTSGLFGLRILVAGDALTCSSAFASPEPNFFHATPGPSPCINKLLICGKGLPTLSTFFF